MADAIVAKKQQKTLLFYMLIVFSFFLVAITISAFGFSYKRMESTIETEREEYVTELTSQVVAKVNTTINKKIAEVLNYANIFNLVEPTSFLRLQEVFNSSKINTEDDKILLLSDKGVVYDINGTTTRITETRFLAEIGSQKLVSSVFSPLGTLGDYWLYGSPINHTLIDGINMIAIIKANKNTIFSEEMTLSMFEHNTYSFLLSDDGNILIKPQNTTAYGSNLVNSLRYSGISTEISESIANNIKSHKAQSVFFSLNNEQWLIQTAFARDEYTVALLLPLQITTSDTVKAMNQTMILVVTFLIIAMISIILVIIITMRSRAEKQIREEQYKTDLIIQTAQNKTDFLSKMSHDIRTPLNGIIGMTYLATDNLDNKIELEDNLSKIQSSADYLLSLVNDILDMSKINSGKMLLHLDKANAEDILSEVATRFTMQAKEHNLKINVTLPQQIPFSYMLDKLRVNQILMNLVSNSVKFTPNNGRIDLVLQIEPLDEETDNITFTIKDTGIGMSQEFMSRIFMSFEQESKNTTLEYGGSGLGLSIVKHLSNLMEGDVKVESQVGVGSSFFVTIPMKKSEKVIKPKLATITPSDIKLKDKKLAGKHVLLAEDHPINAQIVTKILEKWGVEVTVAENGSIAVNRFLFSPPNFYSLIFMDIKMPVMDGFDATKQIRESNHVDAKTIPIYAMSANAFDEDVKDSISCGMNGHLRKPIEIAALKQVLDTNLAK